MIMSKTRKTLLAAALTSAVAACGGGGGGGTTVSATTGVLNVNVTDAAVDDVKRVLVQFTGVSVKPAEGPPEDIQLSGKSRTCQDVLDGTPESDTPEGETTIRCIDLLTLQGTESASLLSGVELDAGNYTWMRLAVEAERGVLDSIVEPDTGGVESLYIPSGSQSGLKLNSSFTILAGGRHNFMIDFDLRKSLNDPQGFPDYRLKPSLRLIDMSESGNIVGTVQAALLTEGAESGCSDSSAVYVYTGDNATVGEEGSGNPPLTSAAVGLDNNSGDWTYTVGFLAPGDYTVAFTCQAGDDDPDSGNDGIEFVDSSDSPAQVLDGQDTRVDFVVD